MHSVDTTRLGVGRVMEVGRDPATQTITFNVGGT
jgi:hypothetical protein